MEQDKISTKPTGKEQRAARNTVHHRLSNECQSEYEQFWQNYEDYIKDHKITLTTLSAKSGININTLRHWRNARNEPRFGSIFEVCEALGVTLPELSNYHKTKIDTTTQQKISNIEKGIAQLIRASQRHEKALKKKV